MAHKPKSRKRASYAPNPEDLHDPPRKKKRKRKKSKKKDRKRKKQRKKSNGSASKQYSNDLELADMIAASARDNNSPLAYRPGHGFHFFGARGWDYDTDNHNTERVVLATLADMQTAMASARNLNKVMRVIKRVDHCAVPEDLWIGGENSYSVGLHDGSLLQAVNGRLKKIPREEAWQHFVLGGLTAPPAEHCRDVEKCIRELLFVDGEPVYFQHLIGAALLGYCGYGGHHEICVLHGPGGTGKSTINEALAAAIGSPLYAAANTKSFMEHGRNTATEAGIATTTGARVLALVEPSIRDYWNAGITKQVSGGDSMRIDRKGQDHIVTRFRALMLVLANHIPRFRGGESLAMTRRMNFLLTRREAPKDKDKDPQLLRKLIGPWRGQVVRWILDGCEMAARENGAPERTKAMRKRTRKAMEATDWMAAFLRARVRKTKPKIRGGKHVRCREMYAVFTHWWEENISKRREPPAYRRFNGIMEDRGFVKRKSKVDGAVSLAFLNCKLIDDADPGNSE